MLLIRLVKEMRETFGSSDTDAISYVKMYKTINTSVGLYLLK